MAVKIQFTSTDLNNPDGIERVLRRFAQVIPTPPKPPAPLDLAQLALDLAPLLSQQLQFNGIAPLNLQSLLPDIDAGVLVGTHSERISTYNPLNYDLGQMFYETDRTTFYINRVVSGSKVWRWAAGMYFDVLANLPVDLSTNDAGFLLSVTDYSHTLRWTGSGWTWGPEDDGSGYYRLAETAPSGFGASAWQICNGSTISRLNPDGSTTSVTVPDVTTARYMKGGLTAAAVAGYSGNTPTGTNESPIEFTGDPAGGVAVQSGAGTTVVAHPYTPDGFVSTPAWTGDPMTALELPNKQAILYYRR